VAPLNRRDGRGGVGAHQPVMGICFMTLGVVALGVSPG
jgi:hypothetical protein